LRAAAEALRLLLLLLGLLVLLLLLLLLLLGEARTKRRIPWLQPGAAQCALKAADSKTVAHAARKTRAQAGP
jgi:hypothetical protein